MIRLQANLFRAVAMGGSSITDYDGICRFSINIWAAAYSRIMALAFAHILRPKEWFTRVMIPGIFADLLLLLVLCEGAIHAWMARR